MKTKKITVGILFIGGLLFVYYLFFTQTKNSVSIILEKYPEVRHLKSFFEDNEGDTLFIADFNDLYRRLFLSKINDSIISFCSIDYGNNNDFLFIISPDSLYIFEAPDLTAYFVTQGICIWNNPSEISLKPMLPKIEDELDLIFEQKQRKFYRIIGFSKEKPNRITHIDNYYGYFTAFGFCHTKTIKNNLLNPSEYIFLSDRNQKYVKRGWRFPFEDNLVPKDSILTRMKNINKCKDSINRRIYPRNDL